MMKRSLTKPMKNLKKRFSQLIMVCLPPVILLLVGACSAKQFVPAPGVSSEDRFALLKADSVLVAVRPQAYTGNYQELNNRFFSVLLRVKNVAATKRKIQNDDFSILAAGKQFDPVPTELILANMRQNHLLQTYEDPFSIMENDDYSLTSDKQQDQYYEVIANSFSFGDVLPGGIKEGYLFFNPAVANADSISLDIFGKRVGFVK